MELTGYYLLLVLTLYVQAFVCFFQCVCVSDFQISFNISVISSYLLLQI